MRRLLAGIALLLSLQGAWAQSPPLERDPIRFPPGQNEIVIKDVPQVPRQLARVATQSRCRFEEELRTEPIRIIRAQPPKFRFMFALVPCPSGIYVPGQVFYIERIISEPIPVQLPVIANRGFGSSARPGYLRWDHATQTLTAEHGSDMCPSPAVRHSYVVGGGREYAVGPNYFDLIRVEWLANRCNGDKNWQTLWEASGWPFEIR